MTEHDSTTTTLIDSTIKSASTVKVSVPGVLLVNTLLALATSVGLSACLEGDSIEGDDLRDATEEREFTSGKIPDRSVADYAEDEEGLGGEAEDLDSVSSEEKLAPVVCKDGTVKGNYCWNNTLIGNGAANRLYTCDGKPNSAPTLAATCKTACVVRQMGVHDYCGAPMMIKTADKAVFQDGNYDENGLLLWSDTPLSKGGMSLSAVHKWDVNGFTEVADPNNAFPGECVSLVKSTVEFGGHKTTSTWGRGAHVIEGGIAIGTPIAMFGGGGGYAYNNWNGHAGFFAGYLISAGHITGFRMWSQNYTERYLVSKHRIEQTGDSSVRDADAYYVIMIPE